MPNVHGCAFTPDILDALDNSTLCQDTSNCEHELCGHYRACEFCTDAVMLLHALVTSGSTLRDVMTIQGLDPRDPLDIGFGAASEKDRTDSTDE